MIRSAGENPETVRARATTDGSARVTCDRQSRAPKQAVASLNPRRHLEP